MIELTFDFHIMRLIVASGIGIIETYQSKIRGSTFARVSLAYLYLQGRTIASIGLNCYIGVLVQGATRHR